MYIVIMENDIVKKGYMYLKRPAANSKLRLRAWVERFILLRDSSFERSARLEIYHSADNIGDNSKQEDCIDLTEVAHIGSYEESTKYPNALIVTTEREKSSSLILASESQDTVREWLVATRLLTEKEQNRSIPQRTLASRRGSSPFSNVSIVSTKRSSTEPPAIFQDILNGKFNNNKAKTTCYPVHIERNCSSLQNKLSGDYKMEVRPETVVLVDIDSGKDAHQWLLCNIKKFKTETSSDYVDLVTMETGLHSKVGEGTFVFKTNYGEEIVRKVRAAVENRQRRRSHCQEKLQLHQSGSLHREAHSTSSPNIHSLSVHGRWSTSACPSHHSSRGCSTPPPIPPRNKTHSGSSNRSSAGMTCEMCVEVFSPGPDESSTIHYACLDHMNPVSDEDATKHDDSGFSESSDDVIFPLDSPTVQFQRHQSPPATLPRMKKRESSFRPPPLPPNTEDEADELTEKPLLPPRRRSLLS